MSSAKVTWSKIQRSIGNQTVLTAAFDKPRPFGAKFVVGRTTSRGIYARRGTERFFLPWPPARHVRVLDARTWMVDDLGAGRTAWQIHS